MRLGLPRNFTADFALCFSEVSVSDESIVFERLNVDGAWLAGTNRVMLAGFGCTAEHGSGEEIHTGPATLFYIGPAIRRGTFAYAGQRWYNNQLATYMQSSVAGTASAGFRLFLADWLERYPEARICGLDRPQDREIGGRCHR